MTKKVKSEPKKRQPGVLAMLFTSIGRRLAEHPELDLPLTETSFSSMSQKNQNKIVEIIARMTDEVLKVVRSGTKGNS